MMDPCCYLRRDQDYDVEIDIAGNDNTINSIKDGQYASRPVWQGMGFDLCSLHTAGKRVIFEARQRDFGGAVQAWALHQSVPTNCLGGGKIRILSNWDWFKLIINRTWCSSREARGKEALQPSWSH